jgi:hypothetical protein
MEKLNTAFTAYKFTPDEIIAARQLNETQVAYLQTLLADAAEEKLAHEHDEHSPIRSAQKEAYLRGQMDILQMLLNTSRVSRPKKYEDTES